MRRFKLQFALATAAAVLVAGTGLVTAGPDHDHDHDHANPLAHAGATAELGALAPDFTLTDTEGNEHTLSTYIADGKVVVLEWFNPECPFVKKHHVKTSSMSDTYAAAVEHENVVWLAINSGGAGKQGNGLELNQEAREEYGMDYPVLLDEDGMVGRAYEAKTTPQMYVISETGMLIYVGAIDDNKDVATLGETNYVNECLSGYFSGEYEPTQNKSYGCSVKYAPAS